MNMHDQLQAMGWQARCAQGQLLALPSKKKNKILEAMGGALEAHSADILAANALDLEEARAEQMTPERLGRLRLSQDRIALMVKNTNNLVSLKDPVGEQISRWIRPNGMEINKVRVPIGVIAILYGARPDLTAESVALCVKSANAVILRGGRAALRTNAAIVTALEEGGSAEGLPENAVQRVASPDREAIRHLVRMTETIDLAVCRGGAELLRTVTELARIPVIKHSCGICHTYIDAAADIAMALDLCQNAKCVCARNTLETLLVHEGVAPEVLPRLQERLAEHGIRCRGDARARALVPGMEEVCDEDWRAEYSGLTLSVAVVDDVHQAISHVNRYGSGHSDAIISTDEKAIRLFTREVDSAVVYVNASPCFTDGASFGMGSDIGISTDKLHARGPMGLEELTTYKYVVNGQGQMRE